ncbi:Uncharacterised protein [Mycobacterium tuberculosis]|nr:Uncharacterised protein [Mycobacterium tuberculosis]
MSRIETARSLFFMPKNKKFNAEQMRLDDELKKERNELSRAK